ncbi:MULTISPECIES: DeoR/GlpR family DNA-binding transcription regulator [Bacillus]|uniref:DeoR family transcriptional regulator, fructose operon transcriptional repressor n=4 Tax=Bacillus amyloliquefaciens group TaxID=1938374 RepID=I2C4G0_BACAY|nr:MULTISPECIES: DeoR/GlpR family DNA-binding transcription regulator [Bacillus]SLB42124.1 DeoR-family transcriptional regulator [Mycobacteroides abscessus subsp. massiliense]AFJ61534.1 DeoR family transcriptional regulator, fructose operon transcriptional repressor [Bacillus velezensis YAU B9601-Y2]AIU81562.1 Lactose phosphotransferase system repressor [Bacillus velezensis]AJE78438.1 DeoR faimly transcriptional regulator [Bacillus sp. BH072]AMQ73875.1 DeoR family transcriptional regulator [Ba
MLTPERYQLIMDQIEKRDVVKIQELISMTNASESTIRRDLSTLEERGFLKRVHGGASKLSNSRQEPDMLEKSSKNLQDKLKIAEEAASLLEEGDCIYLDAGTTTLHMIDFIDHTKDIVVVTNGVMHIDALIRKGIPFYLLGGYVKHRTGAMIGGASLTAVSQYRFDKSFLGVNGVHIEAGFTTPDPDEALLKTKAVRQAKNAYVLADPSKFGEISFAAFAALGDAAIITTEAEELAFDNYQEKTVVKVVKP